MEAKDAITNISVTSMLRERREEIARQVLHRYAEAFPYSNGTKMESELAARWTLREVDDFLDCIAAGGKGNGNYATWMGDAVPVQHKILSPLANRLEMILLYSDVCTEFLWEAYVADPGKLDEAVSAFEGAVTALLISDTVGYASEAFSNGTLSKDWHLGPKGSREVHEGSRSATTTEDLSKRQIQIVKLVAKGRSNGEIANQLGISPNTVRNHIAAVFNKLNVSSRTELAMLALREGLL